jgi:serine phosphatase RsbU (regulator of sigma subunit)
VNKAVGKIFVTIIGLAILLTFDLQPALSQEIIPLSPEKQEQVERYKELVSRYKLANNNQQTVFYLNKIAFIYWENGSLKDAIQYFLESIPFNEKINNYADIKTIYSNVALMYSDLERLDLALEYFLKSLEVRRKLNDKQEIAAGLIDVAYLYTALNQPEKAIPLLEEAFALSKLISNPRLTVNCLRLLSTNYDKLGNIAKAKEYNDLYQVYEQQLAAQEIKTEYESKVLKSETETEREREQRRAQAFLMELNQLKAKAKEDSLSYEVRTRQERALKAEEEASRRQMEIDYLNKDKELQATRFREQQAKSRIQQMIIYSALGFLLLMLILAIIIFKNYRDKKKANELLSLQNIEIQNQRDHIQRQNENINKSINYAQGIQKALLPPQSSLAEIFPESFIFFRPRDIVSGDYYWFRPLLNGEEKNGVATKFAVSAIDCTGHGVPGAFLSMIGYNLLDEIVSKGIHNPGTILKELNNGIRRTLRQDETDNRDGMDMALCIVDKKNRIVEFSGAKNPVVYVVNNEVFRIRGDKESIGGGYGYMENDFTTHQIPIEGPTWFYVFSDGFIDQFGGADGRKFMIKGFVDLLASISILPASQQREMLKNTLKDWLGTQYQQVDDILVVGFMVE